ncbi:hypothetical protein [Nocardiopsis sp. M1B1]|uniref:hypothetical protein n=1 Tax=Nocardiopsis sp. M1B1 TaxID=3450454 RepID=UPI00403A65D5
MYFHPPTLDPGWLATLVGLATLLFLLAQPLLLWPLTRHLGEPAEPGRPSPLTRLQRVTVWVSMAEVLLAVVFVGSARVLTPADIGLVPPRLHGYDPEAPPVLADDPVAWAGTAAVLVWIALFVAALLVQRHRDGVRGQTPPGQRVHLPDLTDAEWRSMPWSFALGGLATTVALFVVVYPLVTVFVGPLAAVAAVALLLGGQQWGNGYQQTLVLTAYGALMALCHAFLSAGSLFVPVVFWCVLAYAYGRSLRQQRLQISQTAPMEVTMLDADGNPVRRPGR